MRHAAFTLLEMMVVLLIAAILIGLSAPRLTTLYNTLQRMHERDDIILRLSGLGYQAFQRGRSFNLTVYPPPPTKSTMGKKPFTFGLVNPENSDDEGTETLEEEPIPLELPPGWRLEAESPIVYLSNGACSGGTVYLSHLEQTFRVQLLPPFCHAKLL